MFLISLIDDLKSVPSGFWGTAGAVVGAVLGAGFTLFTAALSERRTVERARVQREHESGEKARERTMALRREIYLPVAAEYNFALKFLAAMPSYSIEEIAKAEPLTQLAAMTAKLALVSSPTAATAAHKLGVECTILYMQFAPLAMEIAGLRSVSEVYRTIRSKYLAEMEEIRLGMGAILGSGEPDDKRLAGLKFRNEVLRKLFDQEGEKLDDVSKQYLGLHKTFSHRFLPGLRALLDLGVQNIVSMREDLGQHGIADDFVVHIKTSADRVYAVAEETLRGIQP